MKQLPRVLCTLVVALSAPLLPRTSTAIDFEVNTTVDELDFVKCTPATPKNCSLRSAIVWSNQLAGLDTITLKAGVFPITRLGVEPMTNPETLNDFDIRDSVILRGAGMHKTILDGMGKHRLIDIAELEGVPQFVVIEDMTVRNGRLGKYPNVGNGAGIRAYEKFGELADDRDSLTLRRVRLTNNVAEGQLTSAAALDFEGEALLIEDAQFDHNHALELDGKEPAFGLIGAMNVGNSFVMRRTRIHDNTGPNGIAHCMIFVGGFQEVWWDQNELSANGGRKQVCLNSPDGGTALFSNSTFSGNSGEVLFGGESVGLLHVTIVDNNLGQLSERAISKGGLGQLWMKNSIIANPMAAVNCDLESPQKMLSLGNNIVSDDSCALNDPSDHPNTDPKLGKLQFNGSTSRTHMPLLSSVAVDGGETLPEVPVDQRGQPRPVGKSSDIGAAERGPILSVGP